MKSSTNATNLPYMGNNIMRIAGGHRDAGIVVIDRRGMALMM